MQLVLVTVGITLMEKDVYSKENNWFRRNELELLEQARKEREQRIAKRKQEEGSRQREELRKAHWLKCPKCGHDMELINIRASRSSSARFAREFSLTAASLKTYS